MSELNPFPDYTVVPLKAEAGSVHKSTIVTPAIERARSLIDSYSAAWLARKQDNSTKIEPIITAVRGDYGTGKTHLLLDAAGHLRNALIESYPDLKVIRVACKETNILTWFRVSIAPELQGSNDSSQEKAGSGVVERVVLRLYAAAGREVAVRTKLTEGAVKRLNQEPEAIRALIRDNLLNVSAVDDEFGRMLQKACPEATGNVRLALAGTVWIDTAAIALRWLGGGELSPEEHKLLHVSQDLSDEEEASGVLVALAAIHRYLESPFVMMFDELEHLTRYDNSQESKRNITWLKRLLEGMAQYQALTFVSGHWSAWEAQNDYLDRFSQLRPVELVKLTADDVIKIVHTRVPSLKTVTDPAFSKLQAEAVVQNTDGNIRRVLTLCRVLFTQSNGFRNPLTPTEVQSAAIELGQRITPEDAALRIRQVLESSKLAVRSEGVTDTRLPFDLIGYKDSEIRVVVEVKHAVHQTDLHDQAKLFLDLVEELHKTAPEVVACFVADGNVDEELLDLLRVTRSFKLLWYDLTKPDVMTRIAADLKSALSNGAVGGATQDASTAQLSAQKVENEQTIADLEERIRAASADANAGLVEQLREQRITVEEQLARLNEQLYRRENNLREDFLKSVRAQVDELDRKRSLELKQLYDQLEAERRQTQSRREEELLRKQEGEELPKLSLTYAELTRPMPMGTKLRIALGGPQLAIVLTLMVGGVVLFYVGPELGFALRLYGYAISIVMIFGGLLAIWLRVTKVEVFQEYSSRILREIYLRSQSVQDLVRADSILRDSLETYGLLHWKKWAERRLYYDLHGMVGEPHDELIPMPEAQASRAKN